MAELEINWVFSNCFSFKLENIRTRVRIKLRNEKFRWKFMISLFVIINVLLHIFKRYTIFCHFVISSYMRKSSTVVDHEVIATISENWVLIYKTDKKDNKLLLSLVVALIHMLDVVRKSFIWCILFKRRTCHYFFFNDRYFHRLHELPKKYFIVWMN